MVLGLLQLSSDEWSGIQFLPTILALEFHVLDHEKWGAFLLRPGGGWYFFHERFFAFLFFLFLDR